MLSINPRTKLIILSDDREIAITQKQYEAIKADQTIGKYNDPIVIRDADNKEILFDGKIGAIKEFRDLKNVASGLDRYVCDFATRHPIHESCECSEKYGMPPIVFRDRMHKMFPKKYAYQLTLQDKKDILASF